MKQQKSVYYVDHCSTQFKVLNSTGYEIGDFYILHFPFTVFNCFIHTFFDVSIVFTCVSFIISLLLDVMWCTMLFNMFFDTWFITYTYLAMYCWSFAPLLFTYIQECYQTKYYKLWFINKVHKFPKAHTWVSMNL